MLERDFYGPDPSLEQRTYGTVRGLVESYQDPYTYFVEPQPRELERDQLRGRFGGIGAWIEQDAAGYFLRPMPDRPAAQAGVQTGDRLLAVDGQAITRETPLEQVTSLIRGPVDTEVCLDLARPAGDGPSSTWAVCILRAEIETLSVEWRLLEAPDAPAPIGYIRQTLFSERSATEMQAALEELTAGGADRFILDLRGNPGGLVDAAVDVASLWLDDQPVLVQRQADGEEKVFTAAVGDPSRGAPLVVLVDGSTASAAEILAGALQDHGRAVLVGQPTFGKGSVQLVHDLVDGSSLHVTTAHWFTPAGRALEGAGLTPDVGVEEGADPLERAMQIVGEMVGP
ncbi:MAG: S41 family peptidase [Caldilineae bacterium]|nr:MAG: S41 family peptidase [Caldilineae bacterium]